jgi:hypothetical protein
VRVITPNAADKPKLLEAVWARLRAGYYSLRQRRLTQGGSGALGRFKGGGEPQSRLKGVFDGGRLDYA